MTQHKQLPDDMDEECIELCEAMNTLPGIWTIESCCGHGERNYRIWFRADDMKSLPRVLYYFNGCHTGHYDWKVTIETDCAMSYPTLCAVGPIGKRAYSESKHIAELIVRAAQEGKSSIGME